MKKRKILLINQPLNNRGDESAHKGLLRSLVREMPEAEISVLFLGKNMESIQQFTVLSNKVKYVNIEKTPLVYECAIQGLKYHLFFLWILHPTIRKIAAMYKGSDVILCAPGGICMGGFQDWLHLFFLYMAKFVNKPLVYYGRSFGPFPVLTRSHRIFKKYSIEMLHYFSFLSIRDEKTEELAKELNIHYVPTVDSAFLDSPRVLIPVEIENKIAGDDYFVFVPNLLIWHYAYKGRITKKSVLLFYRNILDCLFEKYQNHKAILLPQTFNQGNYNGDDIHFFNDLAEYYNDSRLIVVADTYSSDIHQTIIGKSTCVIGARYHSVVFAINNNIPFVALSYEHKIAGLLSILGKENCMVEMLHALDSEKDMENALNVFENILRTIKDDKEGQALAKHISQECFDKLLVQLDGILTWSH